ARLEWHRDEVLCVAFSPEGSLALSGDEGGNLLLWEVVGQRPLRTLKGHREPVQCVAFANHGRFAISGDAEGTISFWEIATGKERLASGRSPRGRTSPSLRATARG